MHEITPDIYEIIIRYLDGSATLIEKKELKQWMQLSDKNMYDFIDICDLWHSCDVALSDDKEVDHALERLRKQILLSFSYNNKKKQRSFRWQSVAAVFLVMLSLGYAIYTHHTTPRNPTRALIQNQLITAVGSKGRFILPDSSIVWLNSGSKLTYPESFEKDYRKVTLEGEAYFQVTEDRAKPFIVKAGEVDIDVLGTSFNISNYPASSTIETVLLSGSIRANINATGETTRLIPDQLLTYRKETGKTEIEITSSGYHIDWIKDRLIFDYDRLSDIIISLEGWYAVQIDCPKTFADEQRLSFTVRGENLEEILQSMSFIIPIKYSIENNQVKIIPQKKSSLIQTK